MEKNEKNTVPNECKTMNVKKRRERPKCSRTDRMSAVHRVSDLEWLRCEGLIAFWCLLLLFIMMTFVLD